MMATMTGTASWHEVLGCLARQARLNTAVAAGKERAFDSGRLEHLHSPFLDQRVELVGGQAKILFEHQAAVLAQGR